MPRIRSIKPESCTSLTLAKVSERAALLFAYLPCFCDDEGRMKYSPALVKSQVFGLRDNITQKDCIKALDELKDEGLVALYSDGHDDYLSVTHFAEHQHPQKFRKSTLPAPPAQTIPVSDDNNTATVAVTEWYTVGEDSKGEDSRVEEKNIVGQARPIIEYLNEKTGKNFRPTSKKTQSLIKARICDGFTEADFKTVIDNKCAVWKGDPKMDAFLRPETLFGTKFEGYLNEKPKAKKGTEADYAQYR